MVLAYRLAHVPAALQPARESDQIARAEFHRLALGGGHLDLAFHDVAGFGRVVLPVEDTHLFRPGRAPLISAIVSADGFSTLMRTQLLPLALQAVFSADEPSTPVAAVLCFGLAHSHNVRGPAARALSLDRASSPTAG